MLRRAITISLVLHLALFLSLVVYTKPVARLSSDIPTTHDTSAAIDQADLQRHSDKLKTKLKDRGFTVLIETPFVVIGDEPEAVVKQRSEKTVKWAVEKLKKDYFTKDPLSVLEIWLFKDGASYRKHAKEFFNDDPDTPYGYYSSLNKALVMNIATGGGTLVHEIVHPFVEANFSGLSGLV